MPTSGYRSARVPILDYFRIADHSPGRHRQRQVGLSQQRKATKAEGFTRQTSGRGHAGCPSESGEKLLHVMNELRQCR